jgi:EF-P beta-lysylation protein EpmB
MDSANEVALADTARTASSPPDRSDRSLPGIGAFGTWQQEMKWAFRDAGELCRHLRLPPSLAGRAGRETGEFPLFAPRPYVQRIRPGDESDPLLRQILPLPDEAVPAPGFVADPVGDLEAQTHPGVLRKYAGRALLIASGACAVHCRYCFRRHFPYADTPRSSAHWQAALSQLAEDPTLDELILSGGDPLTLHDDLLGQLVEQAAAMPQLRRLRIHTRLPVVIPQRVTDGLLRLLRAARFNTLVVLHINHAREIDADVASALMALRSSGAWLLNQSVLLRGVNDDLDSLIALSEALVQLQIVPYYLHQLDRVAGAAHFEVPVEQGRQLVAQLQAALPGYAVPRYVQDRPGTASKQWL